MRVDNRSYFLFNTQREREREKVCVCRLSSSVVSKALQACYYYHACNVRRKVRLFLLNFHFPYFCEFVRVTCLLSQRKIKSVNLRVTFFCYQIYINMFAISSSAASLGQKCQHVCSSRCACARG